MASEQLKECAICGKKGLDFDDPFLGEECKKFAQFSPAVGDWVCLSKERSDAEGKEGGGAVRFCSPDTRCVHTAPFDGMVSAQPIRSVSDTQS